MQQAVEDINGYAVVVLRTQSRTQPQWQAIELFDRITDTLTDKQRAAKRKFASARADLSNPRPLIMIAHVYFGTIFKTSNIVV